MNAKMLDLGIQLASYSKSNQQLLVPILKTIRNISNNLTMHIRAIEKQEHSKAKLVGRTEHEGGN